MYQQDNPLTSVGEDAIDELAALVAERLRERGSMGTAPAPAPPPLAAPPVSLLRGLTIAGVERTQATQFFAFNGQGSGAATDNTVPMVENKSLVLRVYVNYWRLLSPGATLQITGSVTATRIRLTPFPPVTTPLPPATPINTPVTAMTSATIQRGQANATLNFLVPASSCQGTVIFTIKVWDVANPSFASTAQTQLAGFAPVPMPRVHGVLIHYTGTNAAHTGNLDIPAPTGADLVNTLAPVIRVYPIRSFSYTGCTEIDFDGDLTTPLPASGCGTGWDDLMETIGNMRSASGTDDVYVGLLPSGVPLGGVGGCGGGGVAVSSINASMTFAQEIGHAFGRMHAPCGNPDDVDPNYPAYGSYPPGSIGEFGYDVGTNRVYDPAVTEDFMSYCGPVWTSPYTYVGLRNAITTSAAASSSERPHTRDQAMEQLHINVRIHRDGRVELLPSFHLDGPVLAADTSHGPTTGVECDLVKDDGSVLLTHECHLHNPHQCPRGPSFDLNEVLPWSSDVHGIVFRRGDEVLDTIPVGEPPTVSVRKPRLEHGIILVNWTAKAVAGAPDPRCLLRYSNDDGKTWRAVAADLTSARHGIGLDTVPGGSRCRVQVVASSGVATATAESAPFAVERKPRKAYVINPREPATVALGAVVALNGGGFSPDYGIAPFGEVSWSSSLDGNIGIGYELATVSLSAGCHVITLTVPDGTGGLATATTQVTVEDATY